MIMKPRWKIALILAALPLWLLPVIAIYGWREVRRNELSDIPAAWRYLVGAKP